MRDAAVTNISLLEKLIPRRRRESVRIWIASRFVAPVVSYVELREDLFGRTELLMQTLELRLIRLEQASSAALKIEAATYRAEMARLKVRLAILEKRTGEQPSNLAATASY